MVITMTENIKNQLFSYIDDQREGMINTLSKLISYPSYQQDAEDGAPFGRAVRDCLDCALDVCESFGFNTGNFDGYAGTASFTDSEPELGILAHLDVVPEGTGWTGSPYEARIADGKLFGRGAIDDKGPAVAVIYAMKALKDLGLPLKKSFKLILGTNEENGSADLEYYFKKEAPPKYTFTPDGNYPVINIEKGMIRCFFGAKTHSSIYPRMLMELEGGTVINAVPEGAYAVVGGVSADEIKEAIAKLSSPATLSIKDFGGCIRIDAKGQSAHASTPEMGKNAITSLVSLLASLNLQDEAGQKMKTLSKLFPYGETNGRSLNIDLCDKESGSLTCVLSVISYQAGELNCAIDIRLPASYRVADVKERLIPSLENGGFEISKFSGAEPHSVSSESAFVKTLLKVYEDVTGEKGECIAIGGGTYVHEIEGGVAFGAEFIGEDNHMHSADEFIQIDQLVLNAKMFALAIYEICNSEEL